MSIRRRLIALVVLPTLAIYVALLGFTLVYLQNRARHEVEQAMTRLAGNYAARFDGYLREVARIAETTSRLVGDDPHLTEPRIYSHLESVVEQSPLVYGSCMAFEPGSFKEDDSLFAPYVYRGSEGLTRLNISREVYDWYRDPKYTWFQAPKKEGKGVWSDPYFDEGAGNVLMTTYSAPFFRNGVFRGVTTVDIDLPRLQANVGREIAENLDFVILTAEGRFVFSPDPQNIMHQTIFDVAKRLNRPDLGDLGRGMAAGKPGVASVRGWDSPERQWVFHAPIASAGWTFAARLPERQALAEVRRRMVIAALGAAATLLSIVGCIFFVSGRFTKPIGLLNTKVLEIAGGDLDVRIEPSTGKDEIGQLTRSFNRMTADLRSHVDRLAQEHAARQKMERDLSIARDIQRSLLPVKNPELRGFDFAGWSLAADQTGGDYYDWQQMTDGRVAVSLADVTGHGIGPALVTAVCRAYSRASFPTGAEIGLVLERLNSLLVEDLRGSRFITFVVALVDPKEGSIELLSAGHGPLFVYHAAEDRVEELAAHAIPFGIMSPVEFGPPSEFFMKPGDMVVLITDGFFEWAGPSGEQFGTQRVCDVIRASKALPADRIIARLYDAVLAFAEGTAQQDDLTAVILKRTEVKAAESRKE